MNLQSVLDQMGVNYRVSHHPTAYTAQMLAEAEHVPGRKVIKPVVVQADGEFVMCALPASYRCAARPAAMQPGPPAYGPSSVGRPVASRTSWLRPWMREMRCYHARFATAIAALTPFHRAPAAHPGVSSAMRAAIGVAVAKQRRCTHG